MSVFLRKRQIKRDWDIAMFRQLLVVIKGNSLHIKFIVFVALNRIFPFFFTYLVCKLIYVTVEIYIEMALGAVEIEKSEQDFSAARKFLAAFFPILKKRPCRPLRIK